MLHFPGYLRLVTSSPTFRTRFPKHPLCSSFEIPGVALVLVLLVVLGLFRPFPKGGRSVRCISSCTPSANLRTMDVPSPVSYLYPSDSAQSDAQVHLVRRLAAPPPSAVSGLAV